VKDYLKLGKEKPCCSGKRRQIIEAIRFCLPAPDKQEIIYKLSVSYGFEISDTKQLGRYLGHIRNPENSKEHEWFIPLVERKKGLGHNRYFAIPTDVGDIVKLTEAQLEEIELGAKSTLKHFRTEARNHANIESLLAEYRIKDPFRKTIHEKYAYEFKQLVEGLDKTNEYLSSVEAFQEEKRQFKLLMESKKESA